MSEGPLLTVRDLGVHYPVYKGLLQRVAGTVKAVDGVSFEVRAGETLGLVGESGCGKSTTARAIVRLAPITRGDVTLLGKPISRLEGAELRAARRQVQMIFQDPYASLDPRMSLRDVIAEPLIVHKTVEGKSALDDKVRSLMDDVGLDASMMARYPHELSGGQRQRAGIARALALGPALVIADEPVSALDVSIRAQIVNLLADLQEKKGVAYLFIAHDLAVVRHLSHDVAVMYLGKIVERAPAGVIFDDPMHPYTHLLAAPGRHRGEKKKSLPVVEPASPLNPPSGCAFHPRCEHKMDVCEREAPPLTERATGHLVACHWKGD